MHSQTSQTVSSPKHSTLSALASLNKAAGDEFRLQILRVLRRDSFGVMELAEIFAIRQPGMSHHLKVLADAGLVVRRREGNSIFYHRPHQATIQAFEHLQHNLLELVDELSLPTDIEARLTVVHLQRAASSQLFFETHSKEFAEQQELISEYDVYARPILSLLDKLPSNQRYSVLEIGPGTGQMLHALAQRFDHVTALDNSQDMLDAAKQTLANADNNQPTTIDLILGDSQHALNRGLRVKNIVMNMVLHHVASPAELIRDTSNLLEPNGHLFLAELCNHDQDWVRNSCGDLWLGFAPDEISSWAEHAGLFEPFEGQYLSLRNGFRIQIRHFQLNTPTH